MAVDEINKKMLERVKGSPEYKKLNLLDRFIVVNEFENKFKLQEMEFIEMQEKFFDQMTKKLNKK